MKDGLHKLKNVLCYAFPVLLFFVWVRELKMYRENEDAATFYEKWMYPYKNSPWYVMAAGVGFVLYLVLLLVTYKKHSTRV